MKRILLSLICLMAAISGIAQNKVVHSFLSSTTYNVPGGTPFIENAIAFDCSSVIYKQFEPGKFKATVEIQTIFNFSSPEAIYAWEKGKYIPSIDNMIVIAEVYGVTVDDFIVRDVIEIECDIREAKSAWIKK